MWAGALLRVFLCSLTCLTRASRLEELLEGGSSEASSSGMRAGALLLGRYRLLSGSGSSDWPGGVTGYAKVSHLGKGAFGETWLARDEETGKEVALKFFYQKADGAVKFLTMHDADARSKKLLEMASAECEKARDIVREGNLLMGQERFADCLENKIEDTQVAHLVLEVAGTESLEEYWERKNKSLTASETVRVAKMLLEGLAHIEGKYVHRDIKPANLMVHEGAADGSLHLRYIDFGMVVKEDSVFKTLAGTPLYLPPEFWPEVPQAGSINLKSDFDVYSAGEVLYSLICGRTFHMELVTKIGRWRIRELKEGLQTWSPSEYCTPGDDVRPLFELVVGKMLRGFPEDRWKASALLQDFVFAGVETFKDPWRQRLQSLTRSTAPSNLTTRPRSHQVNWNIVRRVLGQFRPGFGR